MNINTDKLIDIIRSLNNDYNAFAYQQLTVSTTAQSLTLPTVASARYALITVESDISTRAIRYREDGLAPTASTGLIRANMDTFDIVGASNLANFKVILATEAAASTITKINVQYFK